MYYLNKAYELNPNEKILAKLNEMAILHELKGYELSDFNFLILFYKQYSGFLIALLIFFDFNKGADFTEGVRYTTLGISCKIHTF